MKRKPKDRDFIETKEGLLFCVVGYSHPQDRLLSYLKYIPSKEGKWGSGDKRFKRMITFYSSKAVTEAFSYLRDQYPRYLYYSQSDEMTFPAVPYSDVREYYRPEEKLRVLVRRPTELDSLESVAVELASYLADKARMPVKRFGVTGSILLGIHDVAFSDVDLTVYGSTNALLVKQALIREYQRPNGKLRKLNDMESEKWCKRKTQQFSIGYESAESLLKKKWNFGYYRDKFFSVHPTKLDSEITERYGQRQYSSKGPIEVRAKVQDDSWTLFNPSFYRVSQVEVLEGPRVSDVSEVVTYEGIFSDIASDNESIRVKGNLEVVTNNVTNEKYHRIVVGSKNTSSPEYILPVSPSGKNAPPSV